MHRICNPAIVGLIPTSGSISIAPPQGGVYIVNGVIMIYTQPGNFSDKVALPERIVKVDEFIEILETHEDLSELDLFCTTHLNSDGLNGFTFLFNGGYFDTIHLMGFLVTDGKVNLMLMVKPELKRDQLKDYFVNLLNHIEKFNTRYLFEKCFLSRFLNKSIDDPLTQCVELKYDELKDNPLYYFSNQDTFIYLGIYRDWLFFDSDEPMIYSIDRSANESVNPKYADEPWLSYRTRVRVKNAPIALQTEAGEYFLIWRSRAFKDIYFLQTNPFKKGYCYKNKSSLESDVEYYVKGRLDPESELFKWINGELRLVDLKVDKKESDIFKIYLKSIEL